VLVAATALGLLARHLEASGLVKPCLLTWLGAELGFCAWWQLQHVASLGRVAEPHQPQLDVEKVSRLRGNCHIMVAE
jgi:hypothetical protein